MMKVFIGRGIRPIRNGRIVIPRVVPVSGPNSVSSPVLVMVDPLIGDRIRQDYIKRGLILPVSK